jgi:hypothetical protein
MLRRILALVVFACLIPTIFFASHSLAGNQKWIFFRDYEVTKLDPSLYYIKNPALKSNLTAITTYEYTHPSLKTTLLDYLLEFAKITKIQSDRIEAQCTVFELLSVDSNKFQVRISQGLRIRKKDDLFFKKYLDDFKHPIYNLELGQTVTAFCQQFEQDRIDFSQRIVNLPSISKQSQYGETFTVKMEFKDGVVATAIQ